MACRCSCRRCFGRNWFILWNLPSPSSGSFRSDCGSTCAMNLMKPLELTKSISDSNKGQFVRNNSLPLEDHVALFLHPNHSFEKEDDFEIGGEFKFPMLYKTFSIFQSKPEESERVNLPKITSKFTDFNRLTSFLIKFYKCQEIITEDYNFSPEDICILKSFVKRKYKKKIEPELINKKRVHALWKIKGICWNSFF